MTCIVAGNPPGMSSHRPDVPTPSMGTGLCNDWTAGARQGRAISEEIRDKVHNVREYRNYLVHERYDLDPPDQVAIDVARSLLNI